MPSTGFETAVPASERLQTYALDRAATGIGGVIYSCVYSVLYINFLFNIQTRRSLREIKHLLRTAVTLHNTCYRKFYRFNLTLIFGM